MANNSFWSMLSYYIFHHRSVIKSHPLCTESAVT